MAEIENGEVAAAMRRGGEYLDGFRAGMEEAIRISEQQDRTGREWVSGSLWSNIIGRVPAQIRRVLSQLDLDTSK